MWDERYGAVEQFWSGRPNDVLVAEVSGVAPGRALDVGCGEGADAIWLAEQGWQVTGVDVSQVALDRAGAAGRHAGVDVQWVCADVTVAPPTVSGYDLVSVHYPALRHSPDHAAIDALVDAVAPRGTLLVVGHYPLDPEFFRTRGFDPADFVQPGDVAASLDDSWTIEADAPRPRTSPPPPGTPFTHDYVLRARRR